MRSAVGLLVVASILVAGCSSGGGGRGPTAATDDIDYGVEATSTTGVIRGVVYDEAIRPLLGVTVSIATLGRNVTTGDNGEFGFDGLEPGTYFLQATKQGYASIQASAEVVAGESQPPIVKIGLVAIPSEMPYVEAHVLAGYLSFGAAVGLTSVGTTVYGPVADTLGDRSIWDMQFTSLPSWIQGELVWDQTQPAGGEFIWEMTEAGSNSPVGYRETTSTPALAYWNTTVIEEHNETVLDPERGVAYRFFGGPHPALKPPCPSDPVFGINPCYFGYGLTVQQRADAYVHNFFNFAPDEGWRFTEHGDPAVPR